MIIHSLLQKLLLSIVLADPPVEKGNGSESYDRLTKIRIQDNWFVDAYGRVKLFHGINAVSKEYPWIPNGEHLANLTNITELDNLKKWGFNAVRLGVMWSGLRPSRDYVNLTYFNEMIKIIKNLADRDMYVIIDLHQDMLSSKFGAYDGAPRWLVDSMPDSKIAYPWPFNKYDLLFGAYLTESCSYAFQNLYSNANGFQDYFAEYWEIVTPVMRNFTSILAYEIINEPWAGDVYSDPFLLLPGNAGKNNLLPLYDRIHDLIRKHDNDTIIFYEPVTWGVMANGAILGTGFDRPPGNDPLGTALSWHYYCWLYQFDFTSMLSGTISLREFKRTACNTVQRKSSFEAISSYRRQMGTASFLTEFGVCVFVNAEDEQDYHECEQILEANDQYFESWTYWDSEFYNKTNGQVNEGLVNIMSRVYPMSTSGQPIAMSYNTTSKVFQYKYWHNLNITAPTEVFIPEHAYPFGFEITSSGHLNWLFDAENRLALFTSNIKVSEKKFIETQIVVQPKLIADPVSTSQPLAV